MGPIFTAEAKAIDLALNRIADYETSNKFVIFFLLPLDHTSSKNPHIQNLLEKHHDFAKCNEIVYCWIPSHIGIAGNENVDLEKAKDSLNLHPTNFPLPYSNFKLFINRFIVNKWQLLWNNNVGNKLFEIKPVIGQSQPVMADNKKLCLLVCVLVTQGSHTHTFFFSHKNKFLMLIQSNNCLMMYLSIISSF